MKSRNIILYLLTTLTLLSFQHTVFADGYKPFTKTSQVAGQYYQGDGLGYNNYLRLSAEGTFGFEWAGCLGTYDENNGPYRLEKGVVVLSPELHSVRKNFKGMPFQYWPVNWGPRLYLIPKKEMLEFVNGINQGNEPRNSAHGRFYLREGDEKKPVNGFPGLPAEWPDYLLEAPLTGSVIKAQDRKKITLNIGKKHGLKEGMLLTARDPKNTRFAQLRVTAVQEETSLAETLYRDDKVEKDDTVSTRFAFGAQ